MMKSKERKYFDRDLSWLRFNHRVLQEASDKRNPLYERIKFLAIFSSNLDEFFKVRVSAIRQIKSLDKKLRKKLITKPNKLLKKIKNEVQLHQAEFGRIYTQEILPELKELGITFINHQEVSTEQAAYIAQLYKDNFKAKLSIELAEINATETLFIENEKIYLVGKFDEDRLIWIKVDAVPRFNHIPSAQGYQYCMAEDIIKLKFHNDYKLQLYSIKISRDAELYIENEYDGNLLEKIEKSLSNRDTGQVTRALYDSSIPADLLSEVQNALDINETDLVTGSPYHNMKDLFSFPNPTDRRLHYPELIPLPHQQAITNQSIIQSIQAKDRLYYFPYHSFDEVLQLIDEAANDERVTHIKATLYRVSEDSEVGKTLLTALKNGKKVCVFIETKARFDEANNIKWGKRLSDCGAKVIYSYPGIKVHSKIVYIERSDGKKKERLAYIGTGNLNEKTAKIYTDFGLMTANKQLTKEIRSVFQLLEKKLIIPKLKRLMVSPFNSRSAFTDLIIEEIKNAKQGEAAYIILKLNSLQDPKLINLLYKASNAGVSVQLIIRGICCLVPGIKGQSENINVISIVDRFLEHARVYLFANGGNEKIYIGSADWMTRNIDRRIEVITPITDQSAFQFVRQVISSQLNDSVKARYIDKDQSNNYVGKHNSPSSQHLTFELIS